MSWSPSRRCASNQTQSRRSTWFCRIFRIDFDPKDAAGADGVMPAFACLFVSVHRKKFAPSADAHMRAPSRSAFGNASRSQMKMAPESKG